MTDVTIYKDDIHRHKREIVSMSSFPGRTQFGGGSVAAIPRLA